MITQFKLIYLLFLAGLLMINGCSSQYYPSFDGIYQDNNTLLVINEHENYLYLHTDDNTYVGQLWLNTQNQPQRSIDLYLTDNGRYTISDYVGNGLIFLNQKGEIIVTTDEAIFTERDTLVRSLTLKPVSYKTHLKDVIGTFSSSLNASGELLTVYPDGKFTDDASNLLLGCSVNGQLEPSKHYLTLSVSTDYCFDEYQNSDYFGVAFIYRNQFIRIMNNGSFLIWDEKPLSISH